MYDVADYGRMTSDRVRAAAYAKALAATVGPDDVVLDAGTGLGILAVLAVRAGARRVIAVESSPIVHLAREVLEENGVLDRVTLLRGRLEDVSLAEPPTLVVADVRGALPLDAGAPALWRAAHTAAPGARSIPRRDVVFAQPIRSAELSRLVHGFGPVEGVAFTRMRGPLAHARHEEPTDAVALAPERSLFAVEYGAPLPARIEGQADFAVPAGEVVHGFRLGFEADLAPGVSYRSFGEGAARPYGVHVVPTLAPVQAERAARVSLRLAFDVADEGAVVRWRVGVDGKEGPWQGPAVGGPLSLDVLKAGLPTHTPDPDLVDDLDAFVLGEFRHGASVGAAAAAAAKEFLGRLDAERVEARVASLAQRRRSRVVRRLDGP